VSRCAEGIDTHLLQDKHKSVATEAEKAKTGKVEIQKGYAGNNSFHPFFEKSSVGDIIYA
jgi:hypothetical protein